ncbi:MAG: helix-turn-helix domain-containing protein [Thermoplasmata archaeon]|nr:MAG: helix-turn-helix domain-containing protein [Thermoplasmata archaeon]
MDEKGREELKPMFEKVHSYEILEALKIDYEEGICVDLIECILKEDLSIDDIKSIGKMEILSVIKSEGNKHTCLVKYFETEDKMDSFRELDLDLISTTPTIISEKKVTYSCIGENENLTKLVEIFRKEGSKILNMSFKKAAYQRQDILSILTDKQREVLVAAYKFGYYNYPKKINSEQLSKKVNVSKATLMQHLRKAEGRILDDIMAGYS